MCQVKFFFFFQGPVSYREMSTLIIILHLNCNRHIKLSCIHLELYCSLNIMKFVMSDRLNGSFRVQHQLIYSPTPAIFQQKPIKTRRAAGAFSLILKAYVAEPMSSQMP